MRKLCILLLAIAVFFLFCSASAPVDEQGFIKEQIDASGIGGLYQLLPEDGKEWFAEQSIEEGLSLDNLTVAHVFRWLLEKGKDRLSFPLRLFVTVAAILLLSSLCTGLGEGIKSKESKSIFSLVSALAVCGTVASMVTGHILKFSDVIEKLSSFLLSFIPIFAGVAAAAGKPVTAFGYQTVVFGVVQIFSALLVNLLVPMLGFLLAICLTGAVTDVIGISDAAKALKQAILWMLSFFLTIFVGILTLRGLGGTAADTVTNRAAKFAIGTFVPVVGSALSDAYASLSACLGVVKNTVGFFGIAAIAFTLVPPLIELALTLGAVELSGVLARTLTQKRAANLLKAVGSVLSILLGILIFYGMMMIVSISVMLMLGTGG